MAAETSADLSPPREEPSDPPRVRGATRSMTPGRPLSLVSFGQSLATRTLPELERAVRRVTPALLRQLFDGHAAVQELACLRSCHRIEVYAVLRDPGAARALSHGLGGSAGDWTVRTGGPALRHLFRVAAGLDSTAVGEREVREQVLRAGRLCRSRSSRPILRGLFLDAVRSAEALDQASAAGAPSIASVVVDLLLRRPTLQGCRVLVLGSGTVGKKVASLLKGKAKVTLVYHTRAPDSSVLKALDCQALPWGKRSSALESADVVIAAAKGGDHALRASDLPSKGGSAPRLIVDLGLPRNIDPRVAKLAQVELWDLERIRKDAALRGEEPRLEAAAERGAALALETFTAHSWEPWLSLIWRRAEEMRVQELEGALRHAPHLNAQERLVLTRLSERMVRRILSGPTGRLRRIAAKDLSPELLQTVLSLFDEPE